MKTKIYKYGFWLLLLVSLTLFNLWRISKNRSEKEILKYEEKNKFRISSLINIHATGRIDKVVGKNVLNMGKKTDLFLNKSIAILLSEFRCNNCQEKELLRLNSLQKKLKTYGIEIIGITTQAKKNMTAIQKKKLKLNFPIYWVDDTTFSEISVSNDYPQIIYVKSKIIQSSFIPIPLDDEFSEIYFDFFLKKIHG
ncbi:MAG: hypothetical protein IPM32_09180 [Ignavibacteriae bacterium]|nr:hypothetical protein [Ignavibacteriota bacterium]